MPLAPRRTRTLLVSGTHLWNPGDDFVRNGILRVLRDALPECDLNILFYDFNPEEVRPAGAPRLDNRVSPADLPGLAGQIDAVIIAGLSAGTEISPLYEGILAAGLENRVLLLGAGYENTYVDHWIHQEPAASIFRAARLLTGRTAKHPSFIDDIGLEYHHVNCPAILSVPAVRSLDPGRKLERILFSIQVPPEGGIVNQASGRGMHDLALKTLEQLRKDHDVAVLAHHKSEFSHFSQVLPSGVPILFSTFEEDLARIYPQYDLVVTTRLHAGLYANGHGIPAIILNDTDRHTHCLEGFTHSWWVRDEDAFHARFQAIQRMDLHREALALRDFKETLRSRYLRLIKEPLEACFQAPRQKPRAMSLAMEASSELPVHFFTIVLNGEPFIRHHIEVFKQLPFAWHWHIIEGVAELRHDTAWSLANGARIPNDAHRDGRSVDGTSSYLDELAASFPGQVTVYRKPLGEFWDGKLEMVNAPLERVPDGALLWQVDADELWTVEQIERMRRLFLEDTSRSAAWFWCTYFVSPERVITTRNTYGNNGNIEWLRVWRFSSGSRWATHEPPSLHDVSGRDLGTLHPFTHRETEAAGLVFQHYAYAIEAQLRFKEDYYGYRGAVQAWKGMELAKELPLSLCHHFPWVNDHAQVNSIHSCGVHPLASLDSKGSWTFHTHGLSNPAPILLWIRTDAIGDNILASGTLRHIAGRYPRHRIHVLCQERVAEIYQACPFVDEIHTFNTALLSEIREDGTKEYEVLMQRVGAIGADITLCGMQSREPLTDLLVSASRARERISLEGDCSNINAEDKAKSDIFYSQLVPSPAEGRNEMDHHSDFLAGLGLPGIKVQPEVWTRLQDEARIESLLRWHGLEVSRFLVIAPGAQHDMRVFPAFAEALEGPAREGGFAVVGMGSMGERKLVQDILDQLHVHTVNLAGYLSLLECATLLRHARLLAGSDSALAHMACAVGTPSAVVLGGGHFARFVPWSPLHSVAVLPLDCYMCNWRCEHKRSHCVKDVDPAVLRRAIEAALAGPSNRPRLHIQSGWQGAAGEPKYLDLMPHLDPAEVQAETVDARLHNLPDSKEPLLTVVLPSFRRPEQVDAFLHSVRPAMAGLPFEVIGICPTKDAATRNVFKRHGAHWMAEETACPEGFAWGQAMDAAFRRAQAPWVIYASDDIHPEPGAFAKAIALGEVLGRSVGGVACMESTPAEKGTPLWHWRMTAGNHLMINFGIIRRSAFRATPGFHPRYRFYAADWDMCMQVHATGHTILPLMEGRVHHHHRHDALRTSHNAQWDDDAMELVWRWSRNETMPDAIYPVQFLTPKATSSIEDGLAAPFLAQDPAQRQVQAACARAWLDLLPDFAWLRRIHAALGGEPLPLTLPEVHEGKALTTVICAVWHKDPQRHALLKGHQASLDAQSVPVERVYVFDGGDTPPADLKGRCIQVQEGLTIYQAWNRALAEVHTPFVMNLNLDDRLASNAVERFQEALGDGADLVGGDWEIVHKLSEAPLGPCEPADALPVTPQWPPAKGQTTRLGSGTGVRATYGPATAWRRSVHRELPNYPSAFGNGQPIRIIGDDVFWTVLAERGFRLRRLPLLVGQYLSHPTGQAEFRHSGEDEQETYRMASANFL